jgi:hypothetical protein
MHRQSVSSKARDAVQERAVGAFRGVHQMNIVLRGKASGQVRDMPANARPARFNQ